ncbi:hypothetical protein Hypma_013757 [Hypsizygus marmoreus]|uniref:Uncharacterized protein n=1 Tax=Hypsizygus marmoreus TaxID=39966 RepID=A0A369K946_HYPMA|nr:hypothetical protein Hypma_013757 [Hypsizygus marmoreus]
MAQGLVYSCILILSRDSACFHVRFPARGADFGHDAFFLHGGAVPISIPETRTYPLYFVSPNLKIASPLSPSSPPVLSSSLAISSPPPCLQVQAQGCCPCVKDDKEGSVLTWSLCSSGEPPSLLDGTDASSFPRFTFLLHTDRC